MKYKMKDDRYIRGELQAAQSEIVYDCVECDYGCASDDTRYFGIEHISVTKSRNGNYPFFTCPTYLLELLYE